MGMAENASVAPVKSIESHGKAVRSSIDAATTSVGGGTLSHISDNPFFTAVSCKPRRLYYSD